jgi:hypothetical protein
MASDQCLLRHSASTNASPIEINSVRVRNQDQSRGGRFCLRLIRTHPIHEMSALTPVPQTIDPDRWPLTLTGKTYKRKLDSKGCFQLGN